MKTLLDLNDDIEFRLHKFSKKNKSLTISGLINVILQDWCDREDVKEYENSKPKKNKTESGTLDFDWSMCTLNELKIFIDTLIAEHGNDAILEVFPPDKKISYKLLKD